MEILATAYLVKVWIEHLLCFRHGSTGLSIDCVAVPWNPMYGRDISRPCDEDHCNPVIALFEPCPSILSSGGVTRQRNATVYRRVRIRPAAPFDTACQPTQDAEWETLRCTIIQGSLNHPAPPAACVLARPARARRNPAPRPA